MARLQLPGGADALDYLKVLFEVPPVPEKDDDVATILKIESVAWGSGTGTSASAMPLWVRMAAFIARQCRPAAREAG